MPLNNIPLARLLSLLFLTLTLTACGGDDDDDGGGSGSRTYTVGGTVSGLIGTLVLQNNGGDDLTLTGDGSFTFATEVADGGGYRVSVATQPNGQVCTVSDGLGSVNGAAVSDISVVCSTPYSLGGMVSGLNGTLVLQNNDGDDLTLTSDGSFTFATQVADGGGYSVSVASQPSGQVCTVSNGVGSVSGAAVTDISVICSTPYTLGGTVSGLTGTLVLQNNSGDDLTLTRNGSFTFATQVADGSHYSVSVATQPNGQLCSVSNGSGTVAGDVTSVSVVCVSRYTVGGSVSGLSGTLVLRNNDGDDLTLTSDGGFTFATPVAGGSSYRVSVASQPSGQVCTVSNGNGTATGNVTTVGVVCVSQYTVGGSVSGLSGTLVLRNNGGDDLTLTGDGSFTFATRVADGSGYSVSVASQPNGQLCSVSSGSGTASGNVTTVSVVCVSQYGIGGSVSGLSGTLVLQNNGGDDLTLTSDGSFIFATKVGNGSGYSVSVASQPAGQFCNVGSGSGSVAGNVTTVSVVCANQYSIGGSVSSLNGTLVLQNNGGDDLTLTGDGSFTFATPVTDGSGYSVSVASQPSGQLCSVSNGSGTASGNVTTVSVVCANQYTIGGSVTGLSGTLVLQNNGGDDLTLSADGSFAFATPLDSGGSYRVSIASQPGGQSCSVSYGNGTASRNVTTVSVSCASLHTIGGTVSGLSGTLVLQNNNGDDLTLSGSGGFVFTTPLADGAGYNVTVSSKPTGLYCRVTNGKGAVAGNVGDVSVSCVSGVGIGGTIYGVTGSVVLQNNGGDDLTLTDHGDFAFYTPLTSGGSYNVTVASQPAGTTCTVSNGSGTAAGDVSNVEVICFTQLSTRGGYGIGLPQKVAVKGNYAYFAAESGLLIEDISTPTNPTTASFVNLADPILDIAINGNYAYVADGGLLILDISDPTAPVQVGSYQTQGNTNAVYLSGNYIYAAVGFYGLEVIDVSDPTAPSLTGSCDTPNIAYDVAVNGSYAYIADGGDGLQVIDINNPAAPTLVGNSPTTRIAYAVGASGSYAYLGDGSELKVIDISDPTAPTQVATQSGAVRDIVIDGSNAFLAGTGMRIVDISTPTAPVLVGTAGITAWGVAENGGYAYVAAHGYGLSVVDISDLTAPSIVASVDTMREVKAVIPAGSYAYIGDAGYGVRSFDISGAVPSPVSSAGTADARGVALSGNYAYVAGSGMGLYVVDISDPARLSRVGLLSAGVSMIYGVAVRDNYAYLADYGGNSYLRIVDVSDPTSPTLVSSSQSASGWYYDVALGGDYAYMVNPVSGLDIIDISDASSPAYVGSSGSLGNVNYVAADGNYLYVTGSSGLRVVDISDPAAPTLVSSVNGFSAYRASVRNDYAYVTLGYSGLDVYDVIDPANPVLVASFSDHYGRCEAVGADSNGIYLGDYGFGLDVLQAFP